MTAPTRPTDERVSEPPVYVAFELGKKEWKLALTSGFGVVPIVRTIVSGDMHAVERVMQGGRTRLRVRPRRRWPVAMRLAATGSGFIGR